MSDENVELVRRAYERFNANDVDGFLALCDTDIEFEISGPSGLGLVRRARWLPRVVVAARRCLRGLAFRSGRSHRLGRPRLRRNRVNRAREGQWGQGRDGDVQRLDHHRWEGGEARHLRRPRRGAYGRRAFGVAALAPQLHPRSADKSLVSSKALQRGIVVAMLLLTVGGALATYFVSRHNLHSSRNDRVAAAQQRISDALRRRAYYLEDIGDMVGVHDDADFPEFSRWAHVRGRNEGAIVSVEWIRRSPDGTLVPPHDIGSHPMLVAPTDARNAPLAEAVSQPAAANTVGLASLHKRVAISAPVKLANGMRASTWLCPLSPTATAARSRRSNPKARSSASSTRSSSSRRPCPRPEPRARSSSATRSPRLPRSALA